MHKMTGGRRGNSRMAERSRKIHHTAVIGAEVVLGEGVVIGPYCVIDGPITIGDDCFFHSHVQVSGHTTIGARNRFHQSCAIGGEPQDRGYREEHPTKVVIGDDNVFREFVTVNRGTMTGSGVTIVGHNNFLMVSAHIGHDCIVGNNNNFANAACLGGHVELADNCFLSAYVAVQQRSRVGRLVMMGGHSSATRDVPPFMTCRGQTNISGMNLVGMRRAGIARSTIDAIRNSMKLLYYRGLSIPNALIEIESQFGHLPEAAELVSFIRSSKIGVCRATRGLADAQE
jgi:UDP-N-acetylglucosamine acyltransferase